MESLSRPVFYPGGGRAPGAFKLVRVNWSRGIPKPGFLYLERRLDFMACRYVDGTARTNKLHCSDCFARIPKGATVVFELDDCARRPMRNVYCSNCAPAYADDVLQDECHPHSSEALGQW